MADEDPGGANGPGPRAVTVDPVVGQPSEGDPLADRLLAGWFRSLGITFLVATFLNLRVDNGPAIVGPPLALAAAWQLRRLAANSVSDAAQRDLNACSWIAVAVSALGFLAWVPRPAFRSLEPVALVGGLLGTALYARGVGRWARARGWVQTAAAYRRAQHVLLVAGLVLAVTFLAALIATATGGTSAHDLLALRIGNELEGSDDAPWFLMVGGVVAGIAMVWGFLRLGVAALIWRENLLRIKPKDGFLVRASRRGVARVRGHAAPH